MSVTCEIDITNANKGKLRRIAQFLGDNNKVVLSHDIYFYFDIAIATTSEFDGWVIVEYIDDDPKPLKIPFHTTSLFRELWFGGNLIKDIILSRNTLTVIFSE